MARIEEKRNNKSKKNLGNKIWTGIVVTVLTSVVIGGLIIGAIMLFGNKDEETEEKEYDELFPNAELITFEDLDSIFDIYTPNQDLLVDGVIYVFVYSPEYVENLEEGTSEYKYYYDYILPSVNKAVEYFGESYEGHDAFYVINTLSEDNEGLSATGENLTAYNNSEVQLSSLTGPYLLVISRGDSNDFEIPLNGVKENREISSVLNRITKE